MINFLAHAATLVSEIALFLLWLKLRNQTMDWIHEVRNKQELLGKRLTKLEYLEKELEAFTQILEEE